MSSISKEHLDGLPADFAAICDLQLVGQVCAPCHASCGRFTYCVSQLLAAW